MGGFLGILSMWFFRQEYCNGLPFRSLEDLPTQGLNLHLLHWQVGSLPLSHQGSPNRGVRGCTHLLLCSPVRHLSRLHPEDGVPFLICTGPREVWSYHWSSPSQGTQSLGFISSRPTIWIFFFFNRRGYAHGKGEFILKICSLFSEKGRKKETGKERKEKIRRMEMRLPFCLVNCGFIALPWTQLQRGRNQFFSIIPEWERKTDL